MKTIQRTIENITYAIQENPISEYSAITWGVAIKDDKGNTIHEYYVGGSYDANSYLHPKQKVLANRLGCLTMPTEKQPDKDRHLFFRAKKGRFFTCYENSRTISFEKAQKITQTLKDDIEMFFLFVTFFPLFLAWDFLSVITEAVGRIFYKDWRFENKTRELFRGLSGHFYNRRVYKELVKLIESSPNKIIEVSYLPREYRPEVAKEMELIETFENFKGV